MDITKNILIKRLRILKGDASLRQFGASIGVSEGTVRSYLKGKTQPKMKILQKISKEYKVSLEWLMEGEISSSQKPVERIVAETKPPYGEKLLPEEEKFAQIQAYFEEIRAEGPRARGLFMKKFEECFEDFEIWYKTKYHAKMTKSGEDVL